MNNSSTNYDLDKSLWISFVIDNYSKKIKKSRREAFYLLDKSGAFEFIDKNYEVEHLLSFEDVVDDINEFCEREK